MLPFFPLELLLDIMDYLDFKDVVHLAQVCKALEQYIEGCVPCKLRKIIKGQCVVPSPRSTLSVSHLLTRLECSEIAWKYLLIKRSVPVRLCGLGVIEDFAAGVYAVNRYVDCIQSVWFYKISALKSTDLSVESRPMTILSPGLLTFALDPLQDMFAYVVKNYQMDLLYQIRIVSLSEQVSHPKCPYSLLTAVPVSDLFLSWTDVQVRIFNEFIALFDKSHLFIWNWQSDPGRHCRFISVYDISDFIFLSDNTFLIVDQLGELRVNTFYIPEEDATVPMHRVSFCLPELSRGWTFSSIKFGGNSVPASAYEKPTAQADPPILPRQDERILTCTLTVWNDRDPHEPIYDFAFFVNVRTFLDAVSPDEEEEITLYWSSWGPQNTRWISGEEVTDWMFSTYGHRVLDAVPAFNPYHMRAGLKRLRVKDFNLYTILSSSKEPDGDGFGGGQREMWRQARIVDTPSTVRTYGVFEHDITSRLPYREIETYEAFCLTSAMLYDDRIILIKRDRHDQITSSTVLFLA